MVIPVMIIANTTMMVKTARKRKIIPLKALIPKKI